MTHIHKNRIYISTFIEHAKFLIEKSTHEVWIVYKHYLNKEMERLTMDNYQEICDSIQTSYDERVSPKCELFMAFDIGNITMESYDDSYGKLYVDINSTDKSTNNLRFGSKDY
jgi:hypothetical protein